MALVLPLLVLVVMTLVEVGVVARTQIELVNAAREGAREAAVSPDPGRAAAAARRALGDLAPNARIGVERAHVVGGRARVTISLRHRMAAPLLGGFVVELRSGSTMRVER
jgi:Flp pilus assembly protein TadG